SPKKAASIVASSALPHFDRGIHLPNGFTSGQGAAIGLCGCGTDLKKQNTINARKLSMGTKNKQTPHRGRSASRKRLAVMATPSHRKGKERKSIARATRAFPLSK